jgi:hypothetical protein
MAKPNATLVDAVGSGDEPRGHRAAVVAITVGTGRPTCCPTSWLRRPAGQNGRSSLTMPQGYEVPCDRHGRHLRSGAFSGQAPPGPQLAQVVSRLGNGRPPSRRPPALPPAHALERPPGAVQPRPTQTSWFPLAHRQEEARPGEMFGGAGPGGGRMPSSGGITTIWRPTEPFIMMCCVTPVKGAERLLTAN